MCSGIALLIGLFLLGKGDFRFANRYVPKEQGRLIGLILIAPFLIGICTGFLILPAAVGGDGDITLEALVNSPQYSTIASLELGAFVVAVGLALYMILSRPQTPPDTFPPRQAGGHPLNVPPSASYPFGNAPVSAPAAPPPNVMTLAEAAAYLRVSESEVEALIDGGKLPAARASDGYRIARSAIDDYLRQDQA